LVAKSKVDGRRGKQEKRRSIRLAHYDYSQCGAYFITLCVRDRACLFGAIVEGSMNLNHLGELVVSEWQRTAYIRANVEIDQFSVMPNHLHGIVVITDFGSVWHTPSEKFHSPSQTLGAIVRGFKAATTKRINDDRQTPGAAVWQRNYYEHVLRNENDLARIREYVVNNPLQWALDQENPERGVYRYARMASKKFSAAFAHDAMTAIQIRMPSMPRLSQGRMQYAPIIIAPSA
jgi:REP element-mobilizing transposase RayT